MRVFCASLSDVFDAEIPPEWREDLFRLIGQTPSLDWQLLTKRPENIPGMLPPEWATWEEGYFPNVWLGTSVEDQQRANERIPKLLDVPAAVRFLSCEPLLGPIDLLPWIDNAPDEGQATIDWVIVGGESGSKARPFDPLWALGIKEQCEAAGVAFFMKQMGSNPVSYDFADRKGGNIDEWPRDLRVRNFPGASL
jgi:protein gp37